MDPRLRIILLLVFSFGLGLAEDEWVLPLAIGAGAVILWYRSYLARGLLALCLTAVLLVVGSSAVYIIMDVSIAELIVPFVRWMALASVAVVIFWSLSVFEFVTSAAYFGVPVRVALAFGVGVRFLPIIVEEARRVTFVLRQRGISPWCDLPSSAWHFVERATSTLLVSVIRRVDSISLAISTQELERRVEGYRFRPVTVVEWIVGIGAAALGLLAIM